MPWMRLTRMLLPALLALVNAGCLAVAAGAAGAGAVTYYYYKGRVGQDYAASFKDSYHGVIAAMEESKLRVESQQNDGSNGSFTSHLADGTPVTIDLTTTASPLPAGSPSTRINVRVGTFGDQIVSERLLAQIGTKLTSGATASRPGTATQPTIIPTGWNSPSETAPPPELSSDTIKKKP